MKKKISLVLIILCLCIFAYSGFELIKIWKGYKTDSDYYTEVREQVKRQSEEEKKTDYTTKDETIPPADSKPVTESATVKVGDNNEYEITLSTSYKGTSRRYKSYSKYETNQKMQVFHTSFDYLIAPTYSFDLSGLVSKNKDVVGWIMIKDTNIDYPVVQSADNIDYLRKAPDGSGNNAGSIFVDCRISDPFVNRHTIIYGHNQKNKKMFHDLMNYERQSYAEEHPTVEVYSTDGMVYKYEIFSSYYTDSVSLTYTTYFSDAEEYDAWLNKITSLSDVSFNAKPVSGDKVITLSTCTNRMENERRVIHGRLVAVKKQ